MAYRPFIPRGVERTRRRVKAQFGHRRRSVVALLSTSCLIVLLGCTAGPSAELSQSAVTSDAPSTSGLSFGPDPAQLLDIYRPTAGGSIGTIVYLHSGGWISGSRTKVSELMASQLSRGWALVSVDYRLAPTVQAAEMLADVDRAVRWVRLHGADLGVATTTVVVAGGSAGGHLAAMAGAAAGSHVDPALPSDLAAISPVPDGVIDMVGPADLTTFWQAGGWAPDTSSQFLGCALGPTTLDLPPCDVAVASQFSPTDWARRADQAGAQLPPAFLAYGPSDALVPATTQGDPLYDAWSVAAPPRTTRYVKPDGAGHNLEPEIEQSTLATWLDQVAMRTF